MEGNDTRSEFVFEARDHLADMENELLAIEAGGAAANPKLVEKVFRAIHSIKGGAGFLELTTLSQLAHHAESVLSLIGNRQLVPDAPVTEALLKSIDRIRDMIDDIDHSNLVDVSDCVTALHAITTTRRSVATSSGDAPRAVPQAAAARAAAEPTTAQPRVVTQASQKARPGERTASPKPGAPMRANPRRARSHCEEATTQAERSSRSATTAEESTPPSSKRRRSPAA